MTKKMKNKAVLTPATVLEVAPRQDPKLTDKLLWGRIFWVVGTTPKNMTHNCITDPPTNGSQCAFAFPGEKAWMVFCPITFQTYRVTPGSVEHKSFQGAMNPFTPVALGEWLTKKWENFARLGSQVDYNMAARVLKELGAAIPTVVPLVSEEDAHKERGGKPVGDKLLKGVKRDGKRGKVLEWFLSTGAPRSIREAMAEFDASRSSVLSYLHNLNKDHGIGYTLIGDTADVKLPKGCKSAWA